MNKVLIIAAHPDDDILGCGGFLSKYHATKDIRVVFLAEGTTARYPADKIANEDAVRDIGTRTAAARTALEVLGIREVRFCDFPCGRLDRVPILDLNKTIEDELRSYQPDTVFTHAAHDVNNDHGIVYRSMLMATRPGGLYHPPTVLCFETLSSTEWNFSVPFAPNYFEALSREQLELKCRALECYESEIRQFPHSRSREGVETLAKLRGMQAGTTYAEAFRLFRTVVA